MSTSSAETCQHTELHYRTTIASYQLIKKVLTLSAENTCCTSDTLLKLERKWADNIANLDTMPSWPTTNNENNNSTSQTYDKRYGTNVQDLHPLCRPYFNSNVPKYNHPCSNFGRPRPVAKLVRETDATAFPTGMTTRIETNYTINTERRSTINEVMADSAGVNESNANSLRANEHLHNATTSTTPTPTASTTIITAAIQTSSIDYNRLVLGLLVLVEDTIIDEKNIQLYQNTQAYITDNKTYYYARISVLDLKKTIKPMSSINYDTYVTNTNTHLDALTVITGTITVRLQPNGIEVLVPWPCKAVIVPPPDAVLNYVDDADIDDALNTDIIRFSSNGGASSSNRSHKKRKRVSNAQASTTTTEVEMPDPCLMHDHHHTTMNNNINTYNISNDSSKDCEIITGQLIRADLLHELNTHFEHFQQHTPRFALQTNTDNHIVNSSSPRCDYRAVAAITHSNAATYTSVTTSVATTTHTVIVPTNGVNNDNTDAHPLLNPLEDPLVLPAPPDVTIIARLKKLDRSATLWRLYLKDAYVRVNSNDTHTINNAAATTHRSNNINNNKDDLLAFDLILPTCNVTLVNPFGSATLKHLQRSKQRVARS